MGSYTFRWEHPAKEVYVTGTFDNWGKTVKLDENNGVFQKTVELPSEDKIFYKFVADDVWNTDHSAQTEPDAEGNVNNVLYPGNLSTSGVGMMSSVAPGASTTEMAGQQPLESRSSPPGAFPETPAETGKETETTHSISGAPVLPPVLSPQSEREAGGVGMFGLGPQTTNMIPESSLPMGSTAAGQLDAGPTISSAAPGSTTAQLAGQQPLEALSVPERVGESQDKAGSAREASGNEDAVADKKDMEAELKQSVQEQPSTSESGAMGKSEYGVVSAASGSTTAQLAGQQPLEALSAPERVGESQDKAGSAREASGNEDTVVDKQDMEAELKQKVPEQPSTSESGIIGKSEYGVFSAAPGSTTAQLAGEQPLQARGVPGLVEDSQDKAGQGREAAANSEAVAEKKDFETELKQKVPKEPSTSESGLLGKSEHGIAGVAAGGAAIAADAATGAAHTLREKTTETTGRDPVSVLPESVQQSIDGMNKKSADVGAGAPVLSHLTSESNIPRQTEVGGGITAPAGQTTDAVTGVPEEVVTSQKEAGFSPEASADPEMVREKNDMERELAARVPPADEAGEPAPTTSAALSATAPGAPVEGSGAPQLNDPTSGVAPLSMDNEKAAQGTGLNASSETPARVPVATTSGLDTPLQQEDRIVSQMPERATDTTTQREPVITTGVESSKAPISVTATAPAVESSALNASAEDPARVPVATTGGLETPMQQEDRIVSQMPEKTTDTMTQSQPVVTTGVESSKAPADSGAPQLDDPTASVAPISMESGKQGDDSALNASAETPAKVPVATTGGLETPEQQQPQDSRDVSPMSRPATNQSQPQQEEPTVTTGVDSSKTPAKETSANTKETLANAHPFGKQENDPPAAEASTPQKQKSQLPDNSKPKDSPASQRTASSNRSNNDSKKDKRRSLFGRIKDKLKS
ncbi:hypothetical protein MBLNU230_g3846t1 [Neophaeotheca triangularis]